MNIQTLKSQIRSRREARARAKALKELMAPYTLSK